ncbi:MAG TPA: bifunctional riboflavin kinase/FMN adenylyltransferase, partial [Candidatus Glassbacteria bacterium]|nr:bifunctional riboflavin kinase/FMN adenylyltransferase [Candidatus Glassbacteria bacterium]
MVITFDPHPRQVLQPGADITLLSSTAAKIRLFAELGIEYVTVLEFSRELSQVTADRFVIDYLIGRYNMKCLVMGYDHAFGKDRQGGEKVLQELAGIYDYGLIKVPPVIIDGRPVSSSWVRSALEDGDLKTVARLLGSYFSFSGTVVTGAGRGKKLGHPTANLEPVEPGRELFPEGIYAAAVDLDGRMLPGALHHGPRPTFDETENTIELNLFDYTGDLYGKMLEVFVIERIRPILRFDSEEELTRQMDADDEVVRKLFAKMKSSATLLRRAV